MKKHLSKNDDIWSRSRKGETGAGRIKESTQYYTWLTGKPSVVLKVYSKNIEKEERMRNRLQYGKREQGAHQMLHQVNR